MRGHGFRWQRVALLVGTAVGAMGLASVLTAAFAFGDDTALIMGGSGIPIPPPVYVHSLF
jgi:hypothetical protein